MTSMTKTFLHIRPNVSAFPDAYSKFKPAGRQHEFISIFNYGWIYLASFSKSPVRVKQKSAPAGRLCWADTHRGKLINKYQKKTFIWYDDVTINKVHNNVKNNKWFKMNVSFDMGWLLTSTVLTAAWTCSSNMEACVLLAPVSHPAQQTWENISVGPFKVSRSERPTSCLEMFQHESPFMNLAEKSVGLSTIKSLN